MRKLALVFLLALAPAHAQGTVPTFQVKVGQSTYTLAGRDPARGGTTVIPTLLVPIELSFSTKKTEGRDWRMDAGPDAQSILRSPVFADFPFLSGENTQFADAMLRTTFPAVRNWKTLLGKPEVRAVKITVPAGSGYILTSKASGRAIAIVDLEFVQKELFRQVPRQDGKLVIAVTHNTAYYALGDATVCCSWGTHGIDSATNNSFVLASYLSAPPSVVRDADVQPLTQQLGQFFKDPMHDPLVRPARDVVPPGNRVPAWTRPAFPGVCGGTAMASTYFLLDPTDTNPKNNIPASEPFFMESGGTTYHLQNIALLPWYTGTAEGIGSTFSFPDMAALKKPATPCPARGGRGPTTETAAKPTPRTGPPNGKELIGYWSGYAGAASMSPAREISPQWDTILVAFATPDHTAAEGTMQFRTPAGFDKEKFKAEIAALKAQGRRVMISLGGGGQHFTLADPKRVPVFVDSVAKIVSEYGFEGIDIDFESPSLSIDPGDTDFRHPTTPSIVNLIAAIRQLRDRFGPKFLVSLVPEGTQIPAGFPSYGGQFGSYLPIAHALRDILTFMDVQDYNTPPLQGLDGEIYQAGSVDYHAAMTELVLQGFNVGGDPKQFFPPFPPEKVAVGFFTADNTPREVSAAMEFLITGRPPIGGSYPLRRTRGYPGLLGAMFWTLDADRRTGYNFSNLVGPQLHGYPPAKR